MPMTDVLPRSGLPRTGKRFKKVESENASTITDDLFPPFKMEKGNELDEFACQHSQNFTEPSTEFKRENSELDQIHGQMLVSTHVKCPKRDRKIKKQLKLLKQIGKKKAKLMRKVHALRKAGLDFEKINAFL